MGSLRWGIRRFLGGRHLKHVSVGSGAEVSAGNRSFKGCWVGAHKADEWNWWEQ